LDAASYREMFAVDRYAKVRRAIDDICRIKAEDDLPVDIHLLFHVNRPTDELMADARMADLQRPEVTSISAINNFGNWGGVIGADDLPGGAHLVQVATSPERIRQTKKNPCFVYSVNPEITATGLVSACGCMNAEAGELILGDVSREPLRDIWRGETLRKLKASFGTDKLPDICKKCSYYADGERWIRNPALAHFQIGDNPWETLQRHAPPPPWESLSAVLTRLVDQGYRRLALYGAGDFTRTALASPTFQAKTFPLAAIIDDNPALIGERVRNLPIVSQRQAMALGVDAVVLSTDWHTPQMWDASEPLRRAGVYVTAVDQV